MCSIKQKRLKNDCNRGTLTFLHFSAFLKDCGQVLRVRVRVRYFWSNSLGLEKIAS
jgi:hypothetical protein